MVSYCNSLAGCEEGGSNGCGHVTGVGHFDMDSTNYLLSFWATFEEVSPKSYFSAKLCGLSGLPFPVRMLTQNSLKWLLALSVSQDLYHLKQV